MKQSSKRLTSMLGVLLLLVAAFVVFFDLVQPEYANVETLRGQDASEKSLLQSETGAISQIETLISQYKAQSQSQQTIPLALPTGQDLAGAIAQIYGIAQNNGLSLTNIGISAPTLQSQTASTDATGQESIVDPVGIISFQIAVSGSYETFQSFLSELETNIRIFDIQNLTIAQAQPVGTSTKTPAGSNDFFNYTLEVNTYYQLPQASSTPN